MSNDKKNQFRKDSVSNPFETYDRNFKQNMQTPYTTFSSSKVAGEEDIQKRQENSNTMPIAISLPPHLYIPADAQSLDLRNLANVPANTTVDLLTFTAPKGGFVQFIGYGVFFDALMFDLINLVPKVNGTRVFPYHGNPDRNYKIGLGTGSDLSNQNIISCQLTLQPKDRLVWTFTNNDVVDVVAGVRMVGYFDQSTVRKTGRFGG